MAKDHCSSCNTELTNLAGSTRFKCPRCSQTEIVRCKHCREIAAKYKCSACNLEGPN